LRSFRKGMSEMMAIVIGVVLTVAIGAALWPLLSGMITSQSQNAKMIVSVSASDLYNGNVSVIVNVKNVGGTTLEDVKVVKVIVYNGTTAKVIQDIPQPTIASKLVIGASASKMLIVPGQAGDSIVVVVSAKAGNNIIYAQGKAVVTS